VAKRVLPVLLPPPTKESRMKSIKTIIWACVWLVLLGRNGDCGDLTPVAYRLKWLFNTSVVGDLYADVHGAFTRHGIKVMVKEGGPERDAIKELELGYAQFGVASADQVIRAVAKGSPIVVIAQLFQVNPLQWVYRTDKLTLVDPADIGSFVRGKTLGLTFGGNDETIMRTLLAKFGIREESVNVYSVRYDYTPFYEGKVDLWPVYVNAQGIIIQEKLEKAGEKISFLNPDAFGVKFVANSVVTSQKMFSEQPDIVNKFRKSLIEGWRDAVAPENNEKAISVLRRFDKDTPVEIIRRQLAATRGLIKPGPESVIGSIDIPAWKQTEQIMLDQKMISGPIHLDKVLKPFDSIQ
jgi:NitT/TauT family transport system substrate-binding protein